VFLVDLPRLPNDKKISPPELTPFGRELRRFLQAQDMESSIIESLLKFDYAKTTRLAFVHTM
jgi:hypothetical protein